MPYPDGQARSIGTKGGRKGHSKGWKAARQLRDSCMNGIISMKDFQALRRIHPYEKVLFTCLQYALPANGLDASVGPALHQPGFAYSPTRTGLAVTDDYGGKSRPIAQYLERIPSSQ
jgi:hypothetical protein